MRAVIFIALISICSSCSNYSKNERVLKRLSPILIFKQHYPEYKIISQGESLSAGSLMNPYERNSFYIIEGSKPLQETWLWDYSQSIKDVLISNGGDVNSCRKLMGIFYAKDFKTEGPDASGIRITFSVSGSNGVINIRYTAINVPNKPDTIGYLSVDIIEFRQ